jgi:hypothetical protein
MFHGDWVKMCEEFALNFSDKRTGCCLMTMHYLTLSFSPDSTEGLPTTDVIEAEL